LTDLAEKKSSSQQIKSEADTIGVEEFTEILIVHRAVAAEYYAAK
jgi:hypothetical protein